MASQVDSSVIALRDSEPSRLLLVGWGLAALCVLLQGVAEQSLSGGAVSVDSLLRWRLYPIALWGALAPLVLTASRRWPPTRGRWPVRVAVHGLAFSAWMFVSNLLLRLPDLAGGAATSILRESLAAGVEYAPVGATAWALLIAVERAHATVEDAERPDRARGTSELRPGPDAGASSSRSTGEPLQLRVGHRTYLVPAEAIQWVEAAGDYVRVHTEDRVLRVRETMKALHARIGRARFVRIHRSTLVNVRFVREVQPYFHGDHVAILRDGTELRIPRSRKDALGRLVGSDD